MVAGLKELMTKKGDRMAFVTLEDLSGFVEMVVFPEVYQASSELLRSEAPLLVTGTLDVGEESCKLMAKEIVALQDVNLQQTTRVCFRLNTTGLDADQLRALREIVARHRGKCRALLRLQIPNRSETLLKLPDDLLVAASDEIMEEAERLFGYNVVTFE